MPEIRAFRRSLRKAKVRRPSSFPAITTPKAHCTRKVSGQSVPAIRNALSDFLHSVRILGNLVFKFDRGLDIPAVVPDQPQDLDNRRISLSEREIRAHR